MKVYLVRHGQTTFNAQGIHQPSNASLSDLGKKQASDLAERIAHLPIDKVITSNFARALQTAEIINTKINKPLEESELFVEKKRPSEVENQSHQSEPVKKITSQIKENYADPIWHFSDEENYYDVLDRALHALEHLESQKEENLLVVSHGTFIRMLLGVMIFGSDLAPSMGRSMIRALHSHNSGITVAEFKDKQWKILTWNDIAHLG